MNKYKQLPLPLEFKCPEGKEPSYRIEDNISGVIYLVTGNTPNEAAQRCNVRYPFYSIKRLGCLDPIHEPQQLGRNLTSWRKKHKNLPPSRKA